MRYLQIKYVGIAAIFFLLHGCSAISLDKSTRYEDPEGYFSSGVLSAIQPDVTDGKWLEKTFGEPLYSIDKPNKVAIRTWQFSKQKQTKGNLLFLFRYRKNEEQNHYLHVLLQDNIVLKAWRDDYRDVDVEGAMRVVTKPEHQKAPVVELPVTPKKIEPAETRLDSTVMDRPDKGMKKTEVGAATGSAMIAVEKTETKTVPHDSGQSLSAEEQIAVQDALLRATVFREKTP